MAVLARPVPRVRLLEAVEALYRCSLIERGQKHGSFTLQSVILEYATAQLIAEASDEILNGKLARLIDHGLELAQTPEYVRQTRNVCSLFLFWQISTLFSNRQRRKMN